MHESKSQKTVVQWLTEAENICAQHGTRLTDLRRMVLELILAEKTPVKAYDLIDRMREKGERITPASIYRTLDFLIENGLIHRVNTLNAYIPCTEEHEDHNVLMFICSGCHKTEEIDDHVLYDTIETRLGTLGMSLKHGCIEIQGTCPKCTQNCNL